MILTQQELETFDRQGFLKKPAFLDDAAIALLQAESDTLLQGASQPWSEYKAFAKRGHWAPTLFAQSGHPTILYDFLGRSKKIDAVLDALLGQEAIQSMLVDRLGADYRLWYAMIRRTEPGGAPLRMHHDLPREVSICVLLTETIGLDGATVFFSGSNRWPRLLGLFPFLSPKLVGRFLTPATGVPGDVYFFDNGTWHGRYPSFDKSYVSIILSFIPKAVGKQQRIPPPELVEPERIYLKKVLQG